MAIITTTTDTDMGTPPHDVVVEGPAPEADTVGTRHDAREHPEDHPRRWKVTGTIAIVAGIAAAVGTTALLVDRAADTPEPTPLRAPVSGNDAAVGYILSADYPTELHDTTNAPVDLAGNDAALAYILSADYPAALHDAPVERPALSGNDAALAYILSADYPVSTPSDPVVIADPIGVIFSATMADLDR